MQGTQHENTVVLRRGDVGGGLFVKYPSVVHSLPSKQAYVLYSMYDG